MATKRKVERCREFHEEWTMDYLFLEKNGKAICLVCNVTVSSLKKYNIKRHYQTHTNFIREHPEGSELKILDNKKPAKNLNTAETCSAVATND